MLVPALRLELVTVVPAVLPSIAEPHLGHTLVPATTAEQELRTVRPLANLGLVAPVWAVRPAVTNLRSNIKLQILNVSPGLTFSLRRQELSAHCH